MPLLFINNVADASAAVTDEQVTAFIETGQGKNHANLVIENEHDGKQPDLHTIFVNF